MGSKGGLTWGEAARASAAGERLDEELIGHVSFFCRIRGKAAPSFSEPAGMISVGLKLPREREGSAQPAAQGVAGSGPARPPGTASPEPPPLAGVPCFSAGSRETGEVPRPL